MATEFDPTLYVRSPRGDVPTMLALARALGAAAPKNPTPGVAKASRRLRRAATKLERLWASRKHAVARVDKRVADRRIDAAWSAVKARLDGFAAVEASAPEGKRAVILLEMLFPDALGFTKLPYAAEWAESQRMLQRIDAEGLADELAELVGRSIMSELRRAHSEYGKVLGITQAIDRPPSEILTEPLRDVVRAIGDYGLQIAATVDDEDPGSVMAARAALAPIDDMRASLANRGGAGTDAASDAGSDPNGGDVTPPAASPPVPAPPTPVVIPPSPADVPSSLTSQ